MSKDIFCKDREIVIHSNKTCINCCSWDDCNEPNKMPYPRTTNKRWGCIGFAAVVLALLCGSIYLFLDITNLI